MGNNVVQFPTAAGALRLPRWALPGDDFEEIVSTDPLAGGSFQAGTTFTVLLGHIWHGLAHAIDFDGEVYLGVLFFDGPDNALFASWHDGRHSGPYLARHLNILGVVCRIEYADPTIPAWELDLSAGRKQHGTDESDGGLLFGIP